MNVKTWLKAQWDRVLGAGAVLIGVVAILLGYRGVAGTPFPAEQIPYVISGAVVGIALIGVGLTSWLSADLRDEWRKLDRIEHLLPGGPPGGWGVSPRQRRREPPETVSPGVKPSDCSNATESAS
jgi:hypothetical protein